MTAGGIKFSGGSSGKAMAITPNGLATTKATTG